MTSTTYRMSYYPWLTQNVPPPEIDRQIRIFASALTSELVKLGDKESRIDVLPPVDVPQQIEQVVQKRADIALMNPLGLVFAAQQSADVVPVVIALRIIDGAVGDTYFAQLYSHKKTAIRTLAHVTNRSIGYGVPYSTSNFLIPAYLLHQAGVHPLVGVSRLEFLRGHEIVAKAVYDGKIDVGAGHDGVIADLSNQSGYGDAADVLVRIAKSDPIPSDPVVVTMGDTAVRRRLQDALIAASKTAEGKAALKIFWGNAQGLGSADAAKYSGLAAALGALKLDSRDLLPRHT